MNMATGKIRSGENFLSSYTLTKNSEAVNWTINKYLAHRKSGLCFLELTLSCTQSQDTSTVQLLTLPDAMRPAFDIPARGSTGENRADINFTIGTNGIIYVSRIPASTTGTCRLNLTYPAAE